MTSRSRVYNTEVIILRRTDFGEADRLLTVLSPALGKLRVIAKGARKMTSRKSGHVELFARVNLLIAKGRNLDILSQVETLDAHRAIREDLAASAAAHYMCELSEQFAQEGGEERPLYELLSLMLATLGTAPDSQLLTRYFEMRLMSLGGFRPQLARCVRSAAPMDLATIAPGQLWGFSPSEGGLLAPDLAKLARDALLINTPTLVALRALQSNTPAEALSLHFTPYLHGQVERAMRHYLNYILERAPNSRTFMREMFANL